MSINPSSNAVAVSSTAVLLIDDDTTPTGRSEDGRVTYTLFNLGAGIVYLGESDVDDQSGLPLVVNGALSISIRHHGKLYGLCSSGETANVRVMLVP